MPRSVSRVHHSTDEWTDSATEADSDSGRHLVTSTEVYESALVMHREHEDVHRAIEANVKRCNDYGYTERHYTRYQGNTIYPDIHNILHSRSNSVREEVKVAGHHGNTFDDDSLISEEFVEPASGLCGKLFPAGYKQELKATMKIMYGMVVIFICNLSMQPVAVAFGGHLGTTELGAIAMAGFLINVAGSSIAIGLSTAMDTLFSQTYGSKNLPKLGEQLQTSIYIMTCALLLCLSVHFNVETLLKVAGQDHAVARLTGEYCLYFMPGMVFLFAALIINRFLSAQNLIWPQVTAYLLGIVLHAGCQYVFLYKFNWGIMGSALAQVIAYFNNFITMLIYSIYKGVFKETWKGWSYAGLEGWGSFTKLAIYGLLMVCLEWWAFEILIILAGLLGTVDLGAQAVLFNWNSLFFAVPGGIGITVCIRVGQELGAGRPLHAQTASRVAYTISVFVTMTVFICVISLRHYMPYVFTSDHEVAKLAAHMLPLLAVFKLFDDMSIVTRFGVRGMGRQLFGTITVFVCYYFIGLPVGISLMFLTSLRGAGLWVGNAIAMLANMLMFVIYVNCFVDWRNVTKEARKRAGLVVESPPVEDKTYDEKRGLLSPKSSTKTTTKLQSKITMDSFSSSHDESRFMNSTYTRLLLLKRLLTLLIFLAIFLMGWYCHCFIHIEDFEIRGVKHTITNLKVICGNGGGDKWVKDVDNSTTLTTYFFLPPQDIMSN